MCSTAPSKLSSAPSQRARRRPRRPRRTPSAASTARSRSPPAEARGAKSTLPVRSPWTSWLCASTGRRAASSRGHVLHVARTAPPEALPMRSDRRPPSGRSARRAAPAGAHLRAPRGTARRPRSRRPSDAPRAGPRGTPSAPAVDQRRAVAGTPERRNAKAVLDGRPPSTAPCHSSSSALIAHVERLQDEVAGSPSGSLATTERLRLAHAPNPASTCAAAHLRRARCEARDDLGEHARVRRR